ncbi:MULTISPECIES: MOFRL family protein [unclassified Mameliella]|uniref:MOFRL family protein n=1 Tax=unclassified Mameliella TaxID=2630630 RepID=UPI00273ED56C|nr:MULTISPECIES: MOFRL family protein [unclassified Mameliella]
MTHDDARGLLGRMLRAAIGAADPARVLAAHLPEKSRGRCIVVGGGKSAASMAQAVERAWPDVDLSGVVVMRYGYAVPTDRITLREASHPVPDAAARAATVELMSAVAEAGADDLVLALISGGEPTVTVGDRPPGRGGRNTEFLLSLALALDGHKLISAIAADTDGIDGTETAAGAIIDPDFQGDAARRGIDVRCKLEMHDSFTVFEKLGSLVTTGPTLTNVSDFRAILVQA